MTIVDVPKLIIKSKMEQIEPLFRGSLTNVTNLTEEQVEEEAFKIDDIPTRKKMKT